MGTVCRQRAATATWSGSSAEIELPPAVVVDTSPPQLGPYRLLRVLGEGGMARVYVAEHTIIGKQVAIKTLLPQFALSREAREMLVREARIAGGLRHPNLVDIYDFATDDYGRPYYVMELAIGETLTQRLERGPLPLSQCLDITIRLADAVAAIHGAGYLHRDIKSDNVLLTSDGRRIVPKLIDFGIAKALGQTIDHCSEGMVGTPRTMAPEQISQDAVDERTDIWALGVLFYEMLTGHLPFPIGCTVREDLVAIVTEPPRPLPLALTKDIRAIVEACLRKDPEERPPTAVALVDLLRAALGEYLARHKAIERVLAAGEYSSSSPS
jgi:serine/threonine-protein kinase